MVKINYAQLINAAILAREKSYSPYSHFMVGAALLCEDGCLFTGCNIENSAYSPSNCAERTAIFKAISEGNRSFKAIAIVAGGQGKALITTSPCGVCRQVLAEFCDADMQVIMAESESKYTVLTLAELLPMSFQL